MKNTTSCKLNCNKVIFALLSTVLATGVNAASEADPYANPPTPAFAGQTGADAPAISSRYNVDVIATGLDGPRSLVALPNGNLLVADGKGEVRIVSPESGMSDPLPGMPPVRSVGNRGLMDISPANDIADSRSIYMAFPAPPPGQPGGTVSFQERAAAVESGELFQVDKIARARLSADYSRIENVEYIADLPARRLLQAQDGSVYISTMGFGLGNTDASGEVQKLTTTSGKMLRINADGSIPADNPFYGREGLTQEIYSWGHRDPDGAMIHPETGELWTIEHGPMGGDELNRIVAGGNYGWPYVSYGKNYDGSEIGLSASDGVVQPLYYWFPSRALSGLMMYTGAMFADWQGDIFIGTMSPTQGKFLIRLEMDGDRVVAEEHLLVDRDRRVRDVVQGADGALYVLTDSEANNNLDRHFPGEVLRLTPR